MKRYLLAAALSGMLIFSSCTKMDTDQSEKVVKGKTEMVKIDQSAKKNAIDKLIAKHGEDQRARIEKGVFQVASFWFENDGTKAEFEQFCIDNYIADAEKLDATFQQLQKHFEVLWGNFNKVRLDLRRPVDLAIGEYTPMDLKFAAYDAFAHLSEDMFNNKIAFDILLNFPNYTLDEKSKLGKDWSRKDWAYARMGDMYTSRIPAELSQAQTDAYTKSDHYISEYNICMGYLRDNDNKTLFPEDMKLITHWNLRDELKSQYGKADGLEHQDMIYQVMQRIINQDIPECVINSKDFIWNPYSNEVEKDGKKIEATPEPNTRYQHLLNNFHAMKAMDKYTPFTPSYIERRFSANMEIPQETVEKLFVDFVSSPLVKEVAALVKKRLGRDLKPYDIWYDGFKSRSGISQDELSKKTKAKYPNPAALQKDLPNILVKLGFTAEKAKYYSDKIQVDPSRGAGHAAGAMMKGDKARLRTRIGKDGMDYKGYNIAVHEFGHNVEQTMNLYQVDNYIMTGVPNTAFTEAMAFIFQHRDLDLLGMKSNDPNIKHMATLDNFWSTFEIMSVSLVDMRVWKWMYANPEATPAELKGAVTTIAKEVWNSYLAPAFGVKDQPILGIYSHMIDNPLYLSAYPIGHLIEFQIEQHIADKNLATELERMMVQGRLIPQTWMKGAVGSEISIDPTLNATKEALKHIKN